MRWLWLLFIWRGRATFVLVSLLHLDELSVVAGSRPLELHSYDPLRFCTDMLGWIHQAVATEKDYWNSLMRDPSDTLARDSGGHAFAVITDGIVNPLKVRFERVLSANHGPVVLYKIRHWINFYIQKIR